MEFKGLQYTLSGIPLPLEVQEFLQLVGRLVGRCLPELYGLRKGFINLEGTSWPLFPDSTRAAAIEVWVIHYCLALIAFLSGAINLLAQ